MRNDQYADGNQPWDWVRLTEVCGPSPRAHGHLEVKEMRKKQQETEKEQPGKQEQLKNGVPETKLEVMIDCAKCC